jgi:large subunit ribosomal protein L7/L12
VFAPPEGDWEARYHALKAERTAAALSRWEELQAQFPDVDFPSPDNAERPSKRVISVVNKLFNITLLESYQLARLMDQTYGLSAQLAAQQGTMPQGGPSPPSPTAGAAAPSPGAEKKEEAAAAAKSIFTVRLDGFAPADKIKVIKEVRTATGLGLKESKELVEAAPKIVKKDLSKADCDALVAKLKEAGAKITVE